MLMHSSLLSVALVVGLSFAHAQGTPSAPTPELATNRSVTTSANHDASTEAAQRAWAERAMSNFLEDAPQAEKAN